MPATFDPMLASALDRVRLSLGDTDETAPLLEDETITAMLAHQGNDEAKATIALASALIVRFAQEPDKVTLAGDEGAVQWNSRLKGWQALIARLESEGGGAARVSGGMSVLRPSRFGAERSEYRADGRCPW